ncbi:acylphosphatase [Ferroplasma sp.]|uniref:acylphosphatase n=1 Tax=Ferroplasma sp. TaxID=2591003 RepID=UPI002614FC37|nr:acylphosphatase [Ferroplasma sp.]
MAGMEYIFHGNVQGIGFRAHVKKKASELGITGWVKNMDDGSVKAVFSGDPEMISILEAYCRKIPLSEITSVDSIPADNCKFETFEILK